MRDKAFVYYETIAGGMGARPDKDGVSGIHTHMTNTMNTPVEALEFAFPLRLQEYSIRRGTGGVGLHRGGDGVQRDVEFLSPARVTILSERRKRAPYGLQGGHPGHHGENVLLRSGYEEVRLSGKETLDVLAGDVLIIRTPGGGRLGRTYGRVPRRLNSPPYPFVTLGTIPRFRQGGNVGRSRAKEASVVERPLDTGFQRYDCG